jgi:hypothetical protein
MPADVKKEIQLEIAHVLFIDIVGYFGQLPRCSASIRRSIRLERSALPETRRRGSAKIGAEITRGNVNGRADCAPRPAA